MITVTIPVEFEPFIEQEIDCKERLKFTIRRLNAGQKEGRIRFFGDGTGEGICWESLDAATVMKVRQAA